MRPLPAIVLAGFLIGIQPCRSANGQPTNSLDAQTLELGAPKETQRSRTDVQDNLTWLVGRWLCVSRQYTTTPQLSAAVGDCLLEYLNVYLPYSDDRLTLRLTDIPDERPIAAEFLVRHVHDVGGFREELVPMFEAGPVRIGKDSLWYGSPLSEDFNFKYYVKNRDGRVLLILESRAMRFELIKLFSDVGDIRQSFVTAPVKNYSPERIQELKRQYGELAKRPQGAPSAATLPDHTGAK